MSAQTPIVPVRAGLRIEMLSPETLKPFPGNARTHSKRQLRFLSSSMRAIGFTSPVIIDEANTILAGHARVAAAKELGLREAPCVRLSELTEDQKRAYVLADNKIALEANWDKTLLAGELQHLLEIEFPLDALGFTTTEVDILFDAHFEEQTDEGNDDQAPEPQQWAVTQVGETWWMGDHRLHCGDARSHDAYEALLGDERAQLVITDPPYNVKIRGFAGGKGTIQHREFVAASGEMSRSQFVSFLTDSLSHAAEFSAEGSIHFVCMDWRHMDELMEVGGKVYDELKNLIVWSKDNAGMGTFYRSQHELVFAYKKGTAPHINNFELGQYGRNRTNVWRYAGVNSMKKGRLEELAMHPTVKPVAMIADALRDCSHRGGLVLDPFCGSGTVLIAAQKTGRRARALELDPLYVDVAVRRWQSFTGRKATLNGPNGDTFDQIEDMFGHKAGGAE